MQFEVILKDMEWMKLPDLKVMALTIFYITDEQFIQFFEKIPSCFPKLECLTLYIMDLNISRIGNGFKRRELILWNL